MSTTHNKILIGDARSILPTIAPQSVDCVITSPPYYRLRDYAVREQIGLEPHVTGWVDELRQVMHDVARVLTHTGSVWLNLGDSFSHHQRDGAPPKSLLLGPERLALALIDDGWTIRSKVIWAKSNPMPTSVKDRLSSTWEVFLLLARSRSYYFDLDAIRIQHRSRLAHASRAARRRTRSPAGRPAWAGPLAGSNSGLDRIKARGMVGHPVGKNPGDVWTYATSNYRGNHHASFPRRLIIRPLLASCPERVCTRCRTPWERDRARTMGRIAVRGELRARCSCAAPWRPGIVLDPFMGSGTVELAAEEHARNWLGIELNPDYAALAMDRIESERNLRRASESASGEEMPMAA